MCSATLSTLPEELFTSILSHLPARNLFTASPVSHRFQSTSSYLLQSRYRKLDASRLSSFNLIFECCPPSRRPTGTSAFHYCTYKGTTEASDLCGTYSRFVPIPGGDKKARLPNQKLASTTVTFEDGEYFTNLCASSALFRMNTKEGENALVSSVVNVFSDGWFRIRRSWLEAAARTGTGKTLFIDAKKDVGVVLRVKQRTLEGEGSADEDSVVEFEVEFEEVLVRTAHLVEGIEEEVERRKQSGRSVVEFRM